MKILLLFVIFVQSFHTIVNINTKNSNAVKDAKWIAANVVRKKIDLVLYKLCLRNYAQRMLIKEEYKKLKKTDLYNDLGYSNSWENFVAKALLMNRAQFAVQEIDYAVDGAGTDETILINILSSRTFKELKELNIEFMKKHSGKLLSDKTEPDTSGEFKYVITGLGILYDGKSNSFENAKKKAEIFYEDSKKPQNKHYLAALFRYTHKQLKELLKEYEKIADKPIEDVINQHASSTYVASTYLNLIQFVRDKNSLFARLLHESMKGIGVNTRYVLEVILDRWEIDMNKIKEAFKKKYKDDLGSYIQYNFSGGLREALLLLTNERKYLSKTVRKWLVYEL